MDEPVNEPTIVVTIREEDPRFCRAVTLANEIVAALVYGVFEPVSGTIFSAPTLSAVVNELNDEADGVLLTMFVFALARTARNMARALELERGCNATEVLREFLLPPVA